MTTDDRFEGWKSTDKFNMMKSVVGFPDQIEKSFNFCIKQELPQRFTKPQHVVATGLGGSGIPGDFLQRLVQDECPVIVGANKDYRLPAYVNEQTLVFAVSYSGTTEETRSAFHQALKKNAMIYGITSGDRLLQLLQENKLPLFKTPAGYTTRGSFGYLLGAMLGVLSNIKVIPDKSKEVAKTIKMLRKLADQYGPEKMTLANEAVAIATKLYNQVPLIYGSNMLTDAVALRWKHQINENPKSFAHFEVLPDSSHNQIAALKRNKAVAIFLRSSFEGEELARRIDALKRVFKNNGIELIECWGQGNSMLEQLLSLSYLGDFASLYLALLYKVDPTPTEIMSELKEQLKLTDASPDKLHKKG